MAEIIFWLSLLIPFYAYIGFPLGLAIMAAFKPRQIVLAPHPQSISIIVAAHNEERHIEGKIKSLLEQDYLPSARQIIIASDGSTDDTVALARTFNHPDILVLDLPRQGKQAALNTAVQYASGDVLVFTDADNQWFPSTLGALMAPFSDTAVGATGGNMIIAKPGHALSQGDSLYRRYEAWIRRAENQTGCTVALDGALLAIRRSLFQAIPSDVNDDFFISTCAPAAGKHLVYVDAAKVLDEGVDETNKQFSRRLRVTLGGLQSLAYRKQLMNPLRFGGYAVALISHKLIRRLAPLLLIPLILSNLALWQHHGFYQTALLCQIAAYAVAIVGLLDHTKRLPKPFRLAGYTLISLSGMAIAVIQFIFGKRLKMWNPQQNR
ncbi:glycosyltransferase family 2 protein [Pokkaliibacter sp. MBI-7]|uniref:glycosyltransferase family 2 protein n=1 Tax=Pokkaliibacter sp. MBI-7 TaxID=3040600 RepID=UPI00244AC4C4|nr:glycosyltransferase family 2 protein [Pokkaliibacter sp. MBI-7]MDH2432985.1 glycosyltransferase family 2 protein [Pokkaliibacter sp. MBI-7]